MEFEFATSNRIIFGPGQLGQIGVIAADFGNKALVVHGLARSKINKLIDTLEEVDINWVPYNIDHEPTVETIRKGTELARSENCELVISIGGGSAIDCGKAISALLKNAGDIYDYLEVIGKGKPLLNQPVPFIAIPTTSGTGAEVTRNAVIDSHEHKVKVSLRSPKMLPDIALIDPELTLSMPPDITAFTGMDALAQVIEPYVSIKANPLTDSICREGIILGAQSIEIVYVNGNDLEARTDMCLTSLFGGLALANSKLGAVHGFAGPLGGMYQAPHGAVCAALLPHVIKENISALQKRDPKGKALQRYDEIAKLVTNDTAAKAEDGVYWAMDLITKLEIPSLTNFGLKAAEIGDLIQKAKNASSMKGNPIELTDNELENIISNAL